MAHPDLTPPGQSNRCDNQRLYNVARNARDYMLDRKSAPATIARICAVLDVSERTLHYAFVKVFGVTPKHFLKARRMFAAHQALKNAHKRSRISDIATQFGLTRYRLRTNGYDHGFY